MAFLFFQILHTLIMLYLHFKMYALQTCDAACFYKVGFYRSRLCEVLLWEISVSIPTFFMTFKWMLMQQILCG